MTSLPEGSRILGVDPIRRGFAYVVVEVPERLVDWGIHRSATAEGVASRFEEILSRFAPTVIVIDDFEAWSEGSLRRSARDFLKGMKLIAVLRGIRLEMVSRAEVRGVFGAENKHEVAARIAERFPEISPRLPRPRRPWMSEPHRMNIFDACSLVLAFLRR